MSGKLLQVVDGLTEQYKTLPSPTLLSLRKEPPGISIIDAPPVLENALYIFGDSAMALLLVVPLKTPSNKG